MPSPGAAMLVADPDDQVRKEELADPGGTVAGAPRAPPAQPSTRGAGLLGLSSLRRLVTAPHR
jgi:hypothetical protein